MPANPTLPIPSNAHWMPLAALVQVPFIWLLGPVPLASGVPLWLIGALAAPLTYWIAREAGVGVRLAVAAGLLAAIPGALTPFFGQPDNFGLFMTLGALSLWLCARGMAGDRRAFFLGGLVVGAATLARSDAVLLGIPFALVYLRELWPGRERVVGFAAAAGCAALFALVVVPWLYRQLEVFGSIAPSAANGRILWISDYGQLYSVATETTLQTLLAAGPLALLASRIGGLLAALGLFALLPLVGVLVAPALAGAWSRRRDIRFGPFFVYAISLFAANGILFAVHVPHGTFIHSAVALLPHTFVLVVIGISVLAGWAARHRPAWDASKAATFLAYGAVGVAILGAGVQTMTTIGHWRTEQDIQAQLSTALVAQADASDRVMSADAGAYRYLSGHAGIVTPNDPLPTIEQALRDYDVRWLVLERDAIVPALVPVLEGTLQPAWLSRPTAVVYGQPRSAIATTGTLPTAAPAGAVYAVCLRPTDTRCSR